MSKFFQAIGQQSLHRRNTLKLVLGGLAASALSGCSNALVRKDDPQHSLIVGATRSPDSSYALTAMTPAGRIVFQHELPARGHGLAYNPHQQHICVFARRPGDYFDVVDRHSGQLIQRVNAERPRFFYGHGSYSASGKWLFVSESQGPSCQGAIGIYDVASGYSKVSEIDIDGIGPHQIESLSNDVLVCAIGGIKTEGRDKVNLDTMQPSLSYFSHAGDLLERHHLSDSQLSIRHLAVTKDDSVYFAQQHQSPLGVMQPLVYQHRLGENPQPLIASEQQWLEFEGYVGSVAATQQYVFASSPKRGVVGVFEREAGQMVSTLRESDVCGVATRDQLLALSTGLGRVQSSVFTNSVSKHQLNLEWDNHLLWV